MSADGDVSTTYQVNLFKNWNFDRGKTAPLPFVGVPIDLGQFVDLHEHGYAQEYDMLRHQYTSNLLAKWDEVK